MPRPLLAVLAAALALALAGCDVGLGAGPAADGVRLRVTQDFGTKRLGEQTFPDAQGTVMRLLQGHYPVETRYGGGFVESIRGLAGGQENGRPVDWFFYVNGVESEKGAAAVSVHDGDRIWWDRHDWGAAMRVPAVVGSFPEPFLHGYTGKRLPVRVECADPRGKPCATVIDRLHAVGVRNAAPALLGTEAGQEILRVLVGPWSSLRLDNAAIQVEKGPKASGVYATPAPDGHTIDVLDPKGRAVRTLGAGTGMVAATRYADSAPIWFVTGTDETGLRAAANAFDEADLDQRFALVISDGRAVPAPLVGKG